MSLRRWAGAAIACLSLTVSMIVPICGGVLAATGDVLKVKAERANLRAGPSEKSEARGQLQTGDDVIELQRQGDWIGVRVGRTGEEGWIYSSLVELASASRLGREVAPSGPSVPLPAWQLPDRTGPLCRSGKTPCFRASLARSPGAGLPSVSTATSAATPIMTLSQ